MTDRWANSLSDAIHCAVAFYYQQFSTKNMESYDRLHFYPETIYRSFVLHTCIFNTEDCHLLATSRDRISNYWMSFNVNINKDS